MEAVRLGEPAELCVAVEVGQPEEVAAEEREEVEDWVATPVEEDVGVPCATSPGDTVRVGVRVEDLEDRGEEEREAETLGEALVEGDPLGVKEMLAVLDTVPVPTMGGEGVPGSTVKDVDGEPEMVTLPTLTVAVGSTPEEEGDRDTWAGEREGEVVREGDPLDERLALALGVTPWEREAVSVA